MARNELLDNVAHKDLRVATGFGPEYGDAVSMVPAFPTEFADLQREYPLFLRRSAEGDCQAVALLGFERGENLYLREGRWEASYVPGFIARGPFMIGFQARHEGGTVVDEAVIHVDMEHPRVAGAGGEAVFRPHGGHSPYLEHVITVLRGIRDGAEAGKAMYAAFDAHGLLQPLELDLRFDDSHGTRLTGLHGIDRERLQALAPEALHALNRQGYLEGAYLLLASAHNMRRLVGAKQRLLREADGPLAANRMS